MVSCRELSPPCRCVSEGGSSIGPPHPCVVWHYVCYLLAILAEGKLGAPVCTWQEALPLEGAEKNCSWVIDFTVHHTTAQLSSCASDLQGKCSSLAWTRTLSVLFIPRCSDDNIHSTFYPFSVLATSYFQNRVWGRTEKWGSSLLDTTASFPPRPVPISTKAQGFIAWKGMIFFLTKRSNSFSSLQHCSYLMYLPRAAC